MRLVKSANFGAIDLGGDCQSEECSSRDELSEKQAKALFDFAFVPFVVVLGGAVAECLQLLSDLLDARWKDSIESITFDIHSVTRDTKELDRIREIVGSQDRNHQHQTTGVLLFGGRPNVDDVDPCRQERWRARGIA